MFNIIYILVAVLVAIGLGITIALCDRHAELFLYTMAIGAALIWPATLVILLVSLSLELFKLLCIYIANKLDKLKE